MSIVRDICRKNGHYIQSFRLTDVPVPGASAVIVQKFELLCVQCGRTREECLQDNIEVPKELKSK